MSKQSTGNRNMNNFTMRDYVTGLLSVVILVVGFILSDFKSKADSLQQRHTDLAIKVSEDYPKKEELNAARAEFSAAVARVHKRIDDVGVKIDHVIEILNRRSNRKN